MASYPSPNPRNALYNQVDYVQKNLTDQEIQAKLDGKLNYNSAQGLETFGSGIVINGQGTSNGLFVSNSGVDTIPNFQINSTATLAGTNINIGAGMAAASYNPMVQLDDAVITYGIAGGSNSGRLDICPVGTTGGVYFDSSGIAHAQYPIGATANDNTLATTAFVVSQGGGGGVKTNQNNTFLQPYIQSFTCSPTVSNTTAPLRLLNSTSTESASLYIDPSPNNDVTLYSGQTNGGLTIRNISGNSFTVNPSAPNTLSLGTGTGLLNCGDTKITGSLTVTNGSNNSTLTTTATGLNVNDPIVATGNITGNNLVISTATGSLSYPAAAIGSSIPFISGGGAGTGIINISASSLGLLDVANGANSVTLDATGPNTLTLGAGGANVNCGYINLTQVGSSLSFSASAAGPYSPFITGGGAGTGVMNIVATSLGIVDAANGANSVSLDATAPNTLSVGGGGGTLNCGPTNITGGIAVRPVGQDTYSIYSQNGFGLVIANGSGNIGTLTLSNGSTTLTTMTATTTGLVVSQPLITQSLTLSSGANTTGLTPTASGLSVDDAITVPAQTYPLASSNQVSTISYVNAALAASQQVRTTLTYTIPNSNVTTPQITSNLISSNTSTIFTTNSFNPTANTNTFYLNFNQPMYNGTYYDVIIQNITTQSTTGTAFPYLQLSVMSSTQLRIITQQNTFNAGNYYYINLNIVITST